MIFQALEKQSMIFVPDLLRNTSIIIFYYSIYKSKLIHTFIACRDTLMIRCYKLWISWLNDPDVFFPRASIFSIQIKTLSSKSFLVEFLNEDVLSFPTGHENV